MNTPFICKRRGRDSNPRTTLAASGFQDRCTRPAMRPRQYIGGFDDDRPPTISTRYLTRENCEMHRYGRH